MQVAERRAGPPPRTLNPRVDRDLETICLKCLDKEPERRYGSAEALADDLERWLRGEPILARPVRAGAVLKWARRRPERAVLYGLAMLVLLGLHWSVGGWSTEDGRLAADSQQARDEQRGATSKARLATTHGEAGSEGLRHCSAGRLDAGMLILARGLPRPSQCQDRDLENKLRIELGRHAPFLAATLTIERLAHPLTEQINGISLSDDGKRVVVADRFGGYFQVHDVDAGTQS